MKKISMKSSKEVAGGGNGWVTDEEAAQAALGQKKK
jgi:hypothetical protein